MNEPTTDNLKALFREAASQIRAGYGGTTRQIGAVDVAIQSKGDYDCKPTDFDCYSEEDIDRFNDGRWEYIGVIVTITVSGAEIGSASLWGIDHGFVEDAETEIGYLADHVLPDLFAEASGETLTNSKGIVEAAIQVRRLAAQL